MNPNRLILALAAIAVLAVPAIAADDAAKTPATKPARAAASKSHAPVKIPNSVLADVQVIRREFETGKLRAASDYFVQKPNTELTAEIAMMLIGKRQGSSNAMDAYIKWQLLSSLGDQVPEQYVHDVAAAYASAPALDLRPGMAAESRKELDQLLRHTKQTEDVTKHLDEETRRVEALNAPAIGYRDDLLAKLPATFEVVRTGFQDMYQRAESGFPADNTDKVLSKARQLATASDNVADLNRLLDLTTQVRAAKVPGYYDKFAKAQNQSGYVWSERKIDLNNRKQLDEFIDFLDRRLGNPGAPAEDNSKTKKKPKAK